MYVTFLLIIHANYFSYAVFYYDTRLVDIVALAAIDAILIAMPYIIQKHTSMPIYNTKIKCISLSVFSGLLFLVIMGLLISCGGLPLDVGSILLFYLPEVAIQLVSVTTVRHICLSDKNDVHWDSQTKII